MQKKVELFEKLREALCITDSNSKKGLNDDGQDVDPNIALIFQY